MKTPLLNMVFVLVGILLLCVGVLVQKNIPFRKTLMLIGVIVLCLFSIRLGEFLGWISAVADHTRFAKELFVKLQEVPPNLIGPRLIYLSSNFVFPNDKSDVEHEKNLGKLVQSGTQAQ